MIALNAERFAQTANLGDVATLQRGTTITRSQTGDGKIPVIAGGREPAYFHDVSNRDGATIVVAGSGAYAGHVSYWDCPIFVSDAFSIKTQQILDPRFCYHWLLSRQKEIHAFKSGGGVPHVYAKDVARLKIPLPPLEIQQEIVAILDRFTKLEAELEAELEARRRQYHYYRDALLSFGAQTGADAPIPLLLQNMHQDDVDFWMLGDLEDGGLIKLGRGSVISKGDLSNTPGNYPVYSSSASGEGEFGRYGSYMFDDERITWSIDGGGRFFFRQPHRYSVTNVCGWLKVQRVDRIDPKYLFYALSRAWSTKIFDYTKKAHPSVIRNEYNIPVPPIEIQRQIVEILDKFDVLVNDLSSGLPAEINARRRQYAHYRDQLLTFKEAA